MKLRKRSKAAKPVYNEDISEDSDTSHSECSSSDEDIYVPMQKSRGAQRVKNPKRRAPAPPAKKPELLEVALQYLDFRSYLDDRSLKSLHLTCKLIKQLVEGAGALTRFQFSGRGHKAFNDYLNIPVSVQRVESMSIDGKLTLRQGIKFMRQAPPNLKWLELDKTSEGTEAILFSTLPHLTSLNISGGVNTRSEFFSTLVEVAWPLQELEIRSPSTSCQLRSHAWQFP